MDRPAPLGRSQAHGVEECQRGTVQETSYALTPVEPAVWRWGRESPPITTSRRRVVLWRKTWRTVH